MSPAKNLENSAEALAKHAKTRSLQIHNKLHAAMKAMDLDIEQNEGIYPLNGGRISLSEVCRRAGVHKVTLQGLSHKNTTKPLIETWLKRVHGHLITGSKSVRKSVTSRANDWEKKYRAIAHKFNEMYAIEIIERDHKLEQAKKLIDELEAENRKLTATISGGKVIPLPKGRSKN